MATANTTAGRGATEQDDIGRPYVQEFEALEIKETGEESRSQDQDEIDEFEEDVSVSSELCREQRTPDQQEKEENLERENEDLKMQLTVALKDNKRLRKEKRDLEEELLYRQMEEPDESNENANLPELSNGEKSNREKQLEEQLQEMKRQNRNLRIQNISVIKGSKITMEKLLKENEKLKKVIEVLQKKLFEAKIHDQGMQELHPNHPDQRLDANEEFTEKNYNLNDVEDGKNKQPKTKLDKIRDLAKNRRFFNCMASCGMYCVFLIFHFMGLKFCQKKFSLEISVKAHRPSKTSTLSFDPDACEYFVESLRRLKIVKNIFEEDEIKKSSTFNEVLQKAKDAFGERKKSIGLINFGYANASVGHCMVIFQDDDAVQIYDVEKDRPWVKTPNDIENVKLIQVDLVVEEEAKKLLEICSVKTCCPEFLTCML